MSLHVTRFYQSFPHVSTASDKRWDEKPGYEAGEGLLVDLGTVRLQVHKSSEIDEKACGEPILSKDKKEN